MHESGDEQHHRGQVEDRRHPQHQQVTHLLRAATSGLSDTCAQGSLASAPAKLGSSRGCTVIGGAASSSARSAGSDRARIRLRASSARYMGRAKSMPKNITKGWKTCGSKVSSTPLMPTALSSKSVLEQMMQPVPATRPLQARRCVRR